MGKKWIEMCCLGYSRKIRCLADVSAVYICECECVCSAVQNNVAADAGTLLIGPDAARAASQLLAYLAGCLRAALEQLFFLKIYIRFLQDSSGVLKDLLWDWKEQSSKILLLGLSVFHWSFGSSLWAPPFFEIIVRFLWDSFEVLKDPIEIFKKKRTVSWNSVLGFSALCWLFAIGFGAVSLRAQKKSCM